MNARAISTPEKKIDPQPCRAAGHHQPPCRVANTERINTMQYTDDGLESIVGFDLRQIQEVWVGDDCHYRELGTKLIGQPGVLSTHDVPCCLAGIADDGNLFTARMSEITCVIAHFFGRRQALSFPEGLFEGCNGSVYVDDDV